MISYRPFWQTLIARDMSTYDLIHNYGVSANTIHRIRHGQAVTTKTLDELCFILECTIPDLIEYIEDNNVEELADIVEVVYGILDSMDISIEEFEHVRKAKVDKRGAFKDRIYLESAD